jgi:hypothetical protein
MFCSFKNLVPTAIKALQDAEAGGQGGEITSWMRPGHRPGPIAATGTLPA